MFDAVPVELRQAPQWVCYRKVWIEDKQKWSKKPVSAHNGLVADITNPLNWSTFNIAQHIYTSYGQSHDMAGIGFVLGGPAGIAGVDLDNVFAPDGTVINENNYNVANTLNSYTEFSPSRTGLHVLMRATFAGGRRANGVEIYGQQHFFTVTGETYGPARPLAARQSEIDILVKEIDLVRQSSRPAELDWNATAKWTDEQVYNQAHAAANGDKFDDLWAGRWSLHYPSQSEADTALMNIIAFYTDSPMQARNVFMRSPLAQREKTQNRANYVTNLLERAFDRKIPLVASLPMPVMPPVEQPIASPMLGVELPPPSEPHLDEREQEEVEANQDNPFTCPPGLVGEIASYIYNQAKYPMQELAVMAGLGVVAGICGRQYQNSSQGLNVYIMLLAETSSGKDALSQGVARIFDAVCNPPVDFNAPSTAISNAFDAARSFEGPSKLTGKGVLRLFDARPSLSCLSVCPEFSQTMTQMADPRAHTGLVEFMSTLLDFYNKSAVGSRFLGAMNADKTKDIGTLSSPAFSLLCEGTPERFYRSLTEQMVTDGLLSRFIVIHKEGYGAHNSNHAVHTAVPQQLRDKVSALCINVFNLMQAHDTRINIVHTTDAALFSEKLRVYYRERTMAGVSDVHKYLWGRAHQNIERLAGLVAIGENMTAPTITMENLQWASRIIYRQVLLIVGKFKRGEVGVNASEDEEQLKHARRVLEKYIGTPASVIAPRYETSRRAGLIPYAYIQQNCYQVSCFKKDKRGPTEALRRTVDAMVRTGVLERARLDTAAGEHFKVSL